MASPSRYNKAGYVKDDANHVSEILFTAFSSHIMIFLFVLYVPGAFRVEMTKLPGNPRSIQCRYYPTEIGVYYVYVLWSGEHVPGSPFRVNIVDTMEELRNLAEQLEITVNPDDYGTTRSGRSKNKSSENTLRGLIFSDDI